MHLSDGSAIGGTTELLVMAVGISICINPCSPKPYRRQSPTCLLQGPTCRSSASNDGLWEK